MTVRCASKPCMGDKEASADVGFSEGIAKAYGVYQACALSDIEKLTGRSVDDAELTTVILNNREYA